MSKKKKNHIKGRRKFEYFSGFWFFFVLRLRFYSFFFFFFPFWIPEEFREQILGRTTWLLTKACLSSRLDMTHLVLSSGTTWNHGLVSSYWQFVGYTAPLIYYRKAAMIQMNLCLMGAMKNYYELREVVLVSRLCSFSGFMNQAEVSSRISFMFLSRFSDVRLKSWE